MNHLCSEHIKMLISCIKSPKISKFALILKNPISHINSTGFLQAICNKFPQPAPVLCVIWLALGPIICGLTDGKVRALQIKTNKAQSLFASDSLVVSLCANPKGTAFLSGHVDGNVIRFHVTKDHNDDETQGRVILHSVPPYALAWAQGHIFVAGCDKRVSVYANSGKFIKSFDYGKDDDEREFTVATCSPSGQVIENQATQTRKKTSWDG